MQKFEKLIDNKLTQNLFIWAVLYVIFLSAVQASNRYSFAFYMILMFAPAVYINNLWVLNFFKKSKRLFLLLFFTNAILFTVISVFMVKWSSQQALEMRMFVNFLGIMILALVFASAMKLARDSFTRKQQENEAQLKLLKAQLNPHFLFNTLNNLYGLSVIKSDKLPSLMLKLSDLLRYSLYDTKETFVPLEKELKYLENYISLEKIRLEEQTNITFTKTGNFSDKKIAPMLLIVFVENAFKHLDANKANSNVTINVTVKEDTITFSCINTMDATAQHTKNLEQGKSGIGLQNAKKRLQLMYPEKHRFSIEKKDGNYSVNLALDL